MKSQSKGLLYWTDKEKTILMSNLDKDLNELRLLLPARSKQAIYVKAIKETSRLTFKGKIYSHKEILAEKKAIQHVEELIAKSKLSRYKVKSFKIDATSKDLKLSVGNLDITINIKNNE